MESQAYIFLYSILGGILIAFVYDLFRIKRKAVKTAIVFIYLEDLIFWVIVAIVMFAVVYLSNDGEIRGFIFLGTVLGIVIYIILFSKIVINSSMFVLRVIFKVLYFLWVVVTYPFRITIKVLSYPAKFFIKNSKRFLRKAKNISKGKTVKIKFWNKIFKNAIKKI